MDKDRKGCRVRRSPGLAVVRVPSGRAGLKPGAYRELTSGLPAAPPPPRKNGVKRHSGSLADFTSAIAKRALTTFAKRSTPPYSRAAATAFLVIRIAAGSANRLPEHEVCGDCGPRRRAAGLRLTMKLLLPIR